MGDDEIDWSQSSDYIPTVYAPSEIDTGSTTDTPVNDGIGDYFTPGAGTGTLAPYDPGISLSDLTKLFSSAPNLTKALGAAGIGALANSVLGSGSSGPGGYKGGIPNLVASRQMLPIPTTMTNAEGQTVARRPGSGGVTYFSPMQYLTAAQAAAQAEAAKQVATPAAPVAPAPTETVGIGDFMQQQFAAGGMARGGISSLGGYSDGGRLLRGPGDGVSDSIPATIGGHQPARLADGEFVIPARIVSELGNGSTEAGARKLYAMMDRIKKARHKATNIAADTKSEKHLPA
jgi:hypothetical protein